ncbi:MAG: sugar phosphate isomerase/epimerase [Armatimonadetes bacterium]|nr:sugar phosphate isomerase/epimerase [Armatimonadota bacterium]
MKFGICCAPGALGDTIEGLNLLAEAGADYVEWGVSSIMASDAEFESLRAAVAGAPIQAEAFNGFLPAHHRITGPNVDLDAVLTYASEAMRRVQILGGDIVVLGSGGARKVPEDFDKTRALEQFNQFCRELGPRAQEAGITIAVEPLNSREDNLINSVAQGAHIVDEVAHPHIQLLADFYHMFEDREPTQNAADAEKRLQHTHLADLGRLAPGFAEGEADFVGFFSALRAAGYDKRCSFEGKTHDLASQAAPLLATMRARYASAQEGEKGRRGEGE